MTTIEDLARWAAPLALSDIPPRVLEKARWQQASVLAASFAGLHDPGARMVVASTRQHGGQGRARVISGGFHVSRPAAVIANAAVSCTFDYDEILLLGHPGHSSVAVPLVLGEELGRRWGDVVTAQVAANEVAGRLGFSTVLGPQNGQMLPFLHCASAAVAAGKLFGLDEKRLAHALAVALSQPPAALWPAFLGPIESKVLVAAHGAHMGVMAAQLAAEGFEGPLDLLDHPRGFFHRFAFAPLRRALTGLGTAWLSDTLQVKLHACCWYYQALVDGLVDAVAAETASRGRALRVEDIRSVTCRVTFLATAVDAAESATRHPRLTANEVNFSVPALVAWTLLHGRLQPEDLFAEKLGQQEHAVRSLAARVRVVHEPAMTAHVLGAMDRAFDLGALMGDVPLTTLAAAARSLRHEFPHTPTGGGPELAAIVRALPGLVRTWGRGGKTYNMGDRDVASLVLPIPASFEVELEGGRTLRGSRDIPVGALSLPGASTLVAEKLRRAAGHTLGTESAERLVQRIQHIQPDDDVSMLSLPQT